MSDTVLSVNLNAKHGFSKQPQTVVHLLQGRGVQGDAHCGETVQHRYLKRKNPAAPNHMQVHLLQAEVLKELGILPGQLGENITTCGLDLLSLPLGTQLHLGPFAVVQLTGLRTPCSQIDTFRAGLLNAVRVQHRDGTKSARAGAMAIVIKGGDVHPQDEIRVALPPAPHAGMTMM